MGDLMRFLRAHSETLRLYQLLGSYPLAFLSGEELIFLPSLPYHLDFRHTTRDDRYTPYREQVARSRRVAYITTKHPALDDRLRQQFAAHGLTWQEQQIGDFTVFYGLSAPLRPEQIDLGQAYYPEDIPS